MPFFVANPEQLKKETIANPISKITSRLYHDQWRFLHTQQQLQRVFSRHHIPDIHSLPVGYELTHQFLVLTIICNTLNNLSKSFHWRTEVPNIVIAEFSKLRNRFLPILSRNVLPGRIPSQSPECRSQRIKPRIDTNPNSCLFVVLRYFVRRGITQCHQVKRYRSAK